MEKISQEDFEFLKVGDRVMTLRSGPATVVATGVMDSFFKEHMVKLKCDRPKWGCPYFFKYELSHIIK